MSQNRETASDRLVSIIQLIQLGRRTGTLTARRGEGIVQEQGSITFLKGQITQANVGRRNGAEALNTLSAWGNCRFVFISAEETDNVSFPPLPIALPERSGSTGPIPRQAPLPPYPSQITDLPANNGHTKMPQNGSAYTPIGIPYRIRPLDAALRMIENLGLSRSHRRLLLLIDGHRSAVELGRLIGRNEHDIAELLRELVQAEIIRLPGPHSSAPVR